MAAEGGYANDPDDPGGETWRGIARLRHPGWAGWPIIDGLRTSGGFPGTLAGSLELESRVRAFYLLEFWMEIRGADLRNQALAEQVMDHAVHRGVFPASRLLQEALNILNRNGEAWPELKEDGVIGLRTLAALRACLDADPPRRLLGLYTVLRGGDYIDVMRRRPALEKYARGWFARLGVDCQCVASGS